VSVKGSVNLPIIFLSGRAETSVLGGDASACLRKPVNERLLLDAILPRSAGWDITRQRADVRRMGSGSGGFCDLCEESGRGHARTEARCRIDADGYYLKDDSQMNAMPIHVACGRRPRRQLHTPARASDQSTVGSGTGETVPSSVTLSNNTSRSTRWASNP
jgi:hypothetical protein